MGISNEAIAQYSDIIYPYVKGYLYSSSDSYLGELDISNYSYSFSREFNVSILSLDIVAPDFATVTQDMIVVFIEGFDTATATDKIPKFKGRISVIDTSESKDGTNIRIQIYDDLQLLQRTDYDGVFTGTELSASKVTL
nr:hypothetical protein [Candidatus Paceibacterota bacterium]